MRVLLLILGLMFGVAPAESVTAKPLTVALLSDFNGAYGSVTYPAHLTRSLNQILKDWKPDLLLSAGDLIAGQKASLSDSRVRAMWAGFEAAVAAPVRRAGTPYAFTLGNHDASLARDRRLAAEYWQAHAPRLSYLERSAFPFHYTFFLADDTGRTAFFAVIEAAGPNVDEAQRTWLAAQLATPAARAAKVRLVVGHLPLSGLSVGRNKPGEIIAQAAQLVQILKAGRVTAYIHGHHAAAYSGTLNGQGTIASGGIGARDYVGHPGSARDSLSRLTLDLAAGTVKVDIYDAGSGERIAPATLPPFIDGLGGRVVFSEMLKTP